MTTETSPLNSFERISLRIYAEAIQLKYPPDFMIWDKNARHEFNSFLLAVETGIPGSRTQVNERWKTYQEFDTQTTGSENIPQDCAFIIAANHCNQGRLQGNWQSSVMSEAISKVIDGENNQRRFRFLLTPEKFRFFAKNIMATIGSVSDAILISHPREIFQTLDEGDIVGIYPTARAEYNLHKLVSSSGKLFKKVGKRGYPIVPIGSWYDFTNKVYRVNIGKPQYFARTDLGFSDQFIADSIGIKIANLLPEKMRGYYQNISI